MSSYLIIVRCGTVPTKSTTLLVLWKWVWNDTVEHKQVVMFICRNCLFRALVDQLPVQSSHNHRTLRRDVTEYMKNHPDDFAPFMEDDDITFEEYCEYVKI